MCSASGSGSRTGASSASIAAACAPNSSSMRARVPHSAGDSTPAGGWHVLADGLEQLADEALGRPVGHADLAARPAHAQQLAAARCGLGANMQPKVETHGVEAAVVERQRLDVGFAEVDVAAARRRRVRGRASSSARHVVGGGHLAPAARGGERGVAVAGGHVEHALAGAQVERLAQRLADDLQRGADDGVVARRPGGLLAGLDGGEVGRGESAAWQAERWRTMCS